MSDERCCCPEPCAAHPPLTRDLPVRHTVEIRACAVSGCGNDLPPPRDGYTQPICSSCRDYATAKVLRERAAAGNRSRKVRLREALTVLGVNFEATRGPRTGRSARYR